MGVLALLATSGAGGSTAQAPKRGGTVVMSGGPEPACITPYIVACAGGPLMTFVDELPYAVLPGAFAARPDLTWAPQLVSHVDVTKKGRFAITYHIRPEARWSDGAPVSAGDFLFTHRTLARHSAHLDVGDRLALAAVRSVRVLDPKTVRVALESRGLAWRAYYFRVVLPRHVLKGEDYLRVWQERIANPKTGEPIGSGPFLVSGWKRGKQLTLVRNPRYWASHAARLDRLVLRFVEDAPAESFASGEVDLARVRPDDVPSLRRLRDVSVVSAPAPLLENVAIRVGAGGNQLLRNRLVRRALAYGIDRHRIVAESFRQSVPEQQVASNISFLNSSPYYRPNWGRYRYRPVTARRLLERADCRRGADGIYACAGRRLSLRFATRGDIPRRVRTFNLVQRQLRRAGIEVVPQFGSGDAVINQIFSRGDFDLLEYTAVFSGPPDEFAFNLLVCTDSRFNWTRYCQRLDQADVDRVASLSVRQRAREVNQADALLAADVPFLPLYWVPAVFALDSSIKGFVLNPVNAFWRAEDWRLAPER